MLCQEEITGGFAVYNSISYAQKPYSKYQHKK